MDARVEYLKIVQSFDYFLSFCKINDAVTNQIIPFEACPHIGDISRWFNSERQIIILKARQIFVSTTIAMYSLWKTLTNQGFNALIISAGEQPAARLLEKSKFAYGMFPEWIRNSFPTGKFSETEITFPSLGSRIVALPSSEAPAIGETASLVIMDEHDFHRYPEQDFAAAEPTASAGGQIISISTRDRTKVDSFFFDLCQQAIKGENNFKFHFLGWDVRPGRDAVWFENEKKNYIGREEEFKGNFPQTAEEALSPIAVSAFFDEQILRLLLDNSKDPLESREFVHIYSKFIPSAAYGWGADISQGVMRDYQAFVLLAKRGLSVEDVAYIHTNNLQVSTYAFHTNELLRQYNCPLGAAEANSVGRAFLDELIELNYPNMFYRDDKRTKLGWWTDSSSREKALLDLNEALTNGTLLIRYKPLIQELINFQRVQGKTGKFEIRSAGKHDDLVMALAIAYQMVKDQRPNIGKPKSILVERQTGGMYR